jgi:hypothetical protein
MLPIIAIRNKSNSDMVKKCERTKMRRDEEEEDRQKSSLDDGMRVEDESSKVREDDFAGIVNFSCSRLGRPNLRRRRRC